MSTTVHLRDGLQAEIHTRNHVYYADEPISSGGTDTMVTPMEMAMGALGSCVAITAKLYAERKGWPLEGIDVNVEALRFRGDEYPEYDGDEAFVHEIREHITLHGDLTEDQKKRIKEIAGRCPVRRLIATPTFWVEQALMEEGLAE